ncbi:transglutaminase family protein [Alienimonas californiensis]|uniref:Transglutaminase-like domain-containing protein n=1 Tax=Alienimonas californiensis TaxID=2527989 RepID=A0A517PDI4_9PLAN|nr:transglutaminase family protein [Alienimonas californiensis]QDT17445.1 hypothetical protein CA12_35690 [Alienimonas californiensis]
MRFNVRHSTRYRYSSPVALGPQTLRFRPRDGAGQRCVAHTLSIDPQPVGRTEDLDAEGNATEVVWFAGETDRLTITALLTVEIVRENPFDFLIQSTHLPIDYGDFGPLLIPSMARVPGKIPAGDPVAKMAAKLAEQNPEPMKFLTALNDEIHRRCPVRYRETGEPFTPAEVWEGGGACRDLAVLFMDACRTQDLACRFVSGYTSPPEGGSEPELHAWAEVFLPGGGWRAFDPTRGLAVADRHVTVTASADPQFCMPISGGYSGQAETTIDFDLDVVMTEGHSYSYQPSQSQQQ